MSTSQHDRGPLRGTGGPLRGTQKTLPVEARQRNRSLVLRLLFHNPPMSRAELMSATGLTVGSASTIVRDLLAEGLVVELDPQRGQHVGKPRTPVALRPEAFNIVGVDLSDPEDVRASLVDLRGTEIETRSQRVGAADPVDVVAHMVNDLTRLAPAPLLGVGVSAPGVINAGGTVVRSTTYGWAGFPLDELLSERLSLPTVVANDANAAALGEFTFGGASGDALMAITVGRGVGGGVMIGGVLAQRDDHSIGEIGHITAVDGGELCTCGRRGCLETVFSATVIRRLVRERQGADLARGLQEVGRAAGRVLSGVVGALSLHEIRVSVPHGMTVEPLLAEMERVLRERVLPTEPPLTVRAASLASRAQLLGAVALVLSSQLGIA